MMYTYDNTYTDASLTAVSKPCGMVVQLQLMQSLGHSVLGPRRAHGGICGFGYVCVCPLLCWGLFSPLCNIGDMQIGLEYTSGLMYKYKIDCPPPS